MRPLLLLSLLALSLTASAVPLEFSHQGRLFDVAGAPLSGPNTVALALYDAPSGGAELWSEEHTDVLFADGYFAVQVGGAVSLDASLFTGDTLYLGLRVNGGVELPQRLALVSVPYAVRAQDADTAAVAMSVSGGVVDASELRVNGQVIADEAGLQVAPSAHEHDAGDVTSGVLAPGRMPQHNHDANELTTGTLDMNRLPVGTSADTVARGSHTHTAAEIGALPVGTTAAEIGGLADTTRASDIGGLADTTKASDIGGLDVTGGTVSGDLAVTGLFTLGEPGACTSTAAGSLAFDSAAHKLLVCDSERWNTVWPLARGSFTNPGTSCLDVLTSGGSEGDGLYWIDPTGAGAYQVECDMTTDGGGFTFVANLSDGDGDAWSKLNAPQATGPWEDTSTIGTAITHTADYKSEGFNQVTATDLLIKQDAATKVLVANSCWTPQTLRAFFAGLTWNADGSDANWGDTTGAYTCDYAAFGNNDPVLRASTQSPKTLGFKWGERDGVQDGNKDRVMITTWNAAQYPTPHFVDIPVGLGGFTLLSGVEKYEDANECQSDWPGACGANTNQNYGLWVR